MIKVHLTKETKFIFRYKKLYKNIAKEAMSILDIDVDSEINVIITDNNKIKEISRIYKKKNSPTDVLSFPADWKNLQKMIGYNMFGDIYISHEKVKEQAIQYNHSKKREWGYLFAHGLLHCLGYDHKNKKDEDEMNLIAEKIMENVKVGRNE